MPDNEAEEIKVVVDGAEFYAFARAMKRNYQRHVVGEVIMTLRDNKLVIETVRSGCVLACTPSPPLRARIKLGNFTSLVSLVSDAKACGPLAIVFRPSLGEVGLPNVGAKVIFEPTK